MIFPLLLTFIAGAVVGGICGVIFVVVCIEMDVRKDEIKNRKV